MTPSTEGTHFAWALLVLLAFAMGVLAFYQVPQTQLTPFVALASGVVGGGIGTFMGFLWGSSRGSVKKTDALLALQAPAETPADPPL